MPQLKRVLQTMAYFLTNNVGVVYHGEEDPEDAEWDRYLQDSVLAIQTGCDRGYIFSEGGSPSGKQRRELEKVHKPWAEKCGNEPRLAVFNPGMSNFLALSVEMINFVLTPFKKSTPRLKLCKKKEEAYEFLSLSEEEILWVEETCKKLREEIRQKKCLPKKDNTSCHS